MLPVTQRQEVEAGTERCLETGWSGAEGLASLRWAAKEMGGDKGPLLDWASASLLQALLTRLHAQDHPGPAFSNNQASLENLPALDISS